MNQQHEPPLPPGSSEIELKFETPGEIRVKTSAVGSFEATVRLEEIWQKLAFTAYDLEALQQWEEVFLRLAAQCKEMRDRY